MNAAPAHLMPGRRCVACQRARPFEPLFSRDGYQLVRCPGCGLVFQDPQPGASVLSGAYYHDPEYARAVFGELRPVALANARRSLALVGTAAIRPGTRVLEVGAGSGAWLELVVAAGARAVGVEIGAELAARARDRGLDVRAGTLEENLAALGSEQFDLVAFWDVIEHLADPVRELSLARSLLAPEGRLAATMPNVEGLYPRLTYRILARRTGIWEYPELPVHLFDFSPRTIRLVLGRAGFDVERVRTFATPYRHYRTTTLSRRRTGTGARAALLRAAFDILHRGAYPLARLLGRGNSMFVLARRAGPE